MITTLIIIWNNCLKPNSNYQVNNKENIFHQLNYNALSTWKIEVPLKTHITLQNFQNSTHFIDGYPVFLSNLLPCIIYRTFGGIS